MLTADEWDDFFVLLDKVVSQDGLARHQLMEQLRRESSKRDAEDSLESLQMLLHYDYIGE